MFLKLKKSQQEGKYSQGLLKNYLFKTMPFYLEQFSHLQVRTETVLKGHSFK